MLFLSETNFLLKIDSAKLIWQTTARLSNMEAHFRQTSACLRKTRVWYSKSQIINTNTKIDELMDTDRALIQNERRKLFSNEPVVTQSPAHADSVKIIILRQRNMCTRAQHLIRRQRLGIESDARSTM